MLNHDSGTVIWRRKRVHTDWSLDLANIFVTVLSRVGQNTLHSGHDFFHTSMPLRLNPCRHAWNTKLALLVLLMRERTVFKPPALCLLRAAGWSQVTSICQSCLCCTIKRTKVHVRIVLPRTRTVAQAMSMAFHALVPSRINARYELQALGLGELLCRGGGVRLHALQHCRGRMRVCATRVVRSLHLFDSARP